MSQLGSNGEEVADDRESGAPVVTEPGSVVAPTQVGGELFISIGEREEAVIIVEEVLIGTVRTFHLSVMSRCGDANQLMLDAIVL